MSSRKGSAIAAAAAAAIGLSVLLAPAANAANPTIVVWADISKVDGIKAIAANYTAADVQVVNKANLKDSVDALKDAAGAPDIVVSAHDWIGGQSSNGIIVKLSVPAQTKAQFPPAVYNAFNYGGDQYGVPLSVENIAWVQNAAIMGKKCPTTLAGALATIAAYEKKTHKKLAEKISVPGNDPYHFFPLASGLGAFVFGTNDDGSLNPKSVGFDNPTFLKNVKKFLPVWQKTHLFSNFAGKGAGSGNWDPNNNYATGKAAVIFTGPWYSTQIDALKIKSVYCSFPSIVKGIVSRPFSGVQGLTVTKFADAHGVDAAAKAFVNFATTAANDTLYAKIANVLPANKAAKAPNKTLQGFANAGAVSIPMPNIPQMNSVWGFMSQGWAKSLAKTNPTNPVQAWKDATQNIRDAIKG